MWGCTIIHLKQLIFSESRLNSKWILCYDSIMDQLPDRYRCTICRKTFNDLTSHIIQTNHYGNSQFIVGVFGENQGKSGYRNVRFPVTFQSVRDKIKKDK